MVGGVSALEKMLARAGKAPTDFSARSKMGKIFRRQGVSRSAELERILRLPTREQVIGPAACGELPGMLTEWLKTPAGTMSLRPVQALALQEMHDLGGLLAPIRVGGGKTLITLLSATVLEVERPLLLVPAKLKRKTVLDAAELRKHWRITVPRIESYELLGRAHSAEMLTEWKPGLIICDEAHKLKNLKAAVTRRVARFMEAHPSTCFVAMSGTITKRSLNDYAHLAEWALGEVLAPVPLKWGVLQEWCDALDEKVDEGKRLAVGALTELCRDGEPHTLDGVRRAFRERLVSTPGVVATDVSPVDCSLTLEAFEPAYGPQTEDAFAEMRALWVTPDGWEIPDAPSYWRHARELACGFYYVWDPRPPKHWMEARAEWCRFVRETLRHNQRGLDSELQVTNAVDRGLYEAGPLAAWRAVRDDFKPNTVPRWVDKTVIKHAAAWLGTDAGIVWVEHIAMGAELARFTGLPFYGRQGLSQDGEPIEKASGKIIASVLANSEGRNLQAWCRNLVISAPPNGAAWEQLIGRTHRDGQESDEVTFEILCGCLQQWAGFEQARADARYIQDSTGQSQKLIIGDVIWPSPDEAAARGRSSSRWNSS